MSQPDPPAGTADGPPADSHPPAAAAAAALNNNTTTEPDAVAITFHIDEDEDDEEQMEGVPPRLHASPDHDYEDAGQGFVSHRSRTLTGPALWPPVSPSNIAQPPGEVEMAERKGFLGDSGRVLSRQPSAAKPTEAESPAEEKKQQDGTVAVVGPAPPDAIWMISPAELSKKFSDSGLTLDNMRQSRGLTSERAAELLAQNGRNELKPPKEHSEIVKYLLQYTDPFMAMLFGAGILSACVAYPIDTSQSLNLYIGIILWAVVVVSATFSYVQEGKASDVMKSFKSMLPAQARVVRDGQEVRIPAAEIVVGDLLKVGGGDIVPADMRLIWQQDCKVETSSLTGESLPITCSVKSQDAPKIEQARNICFNSSKCLEGEAWGVVFATGDASLIGQIAGLAGETKKALTTLQKEIKIFVKSLTAVAFCVGCIFFAISMAKGQTFIYSFINSFIIVMIACVPEGLPMTVVSCLTITAKRMSEKNVFIKQLQSVETLGSITVIASDKTGTLTQNKMAVANMWFDTSAHTADSVFQHFPLHRLQHKSSSVSVAGEYHVGATLEQLELIAVICSKTRFADERQLTAAQAKQMQQVEALKSMDPSMTMRRARVQYPTLMGAMDSGVSLTTGRSKMFANLADVIMDDAAREVIGDASETALFNFVRQRQSIELMRYHHQRVYEVPFNSRNKYALTVTKRVGLAHESPERRQLLMKGAPEVVLARCDSYMYRGEVRPIDARFKTEFAAAYERFGNMGQRVLGFAMLELPEDKFGSKFDAMYSTQPDAVPVHGLVFVGLMSLVDPPKESVPQAVLDCHSAGIKVIMVTGDHPLTAAAIARQTNIFLPGHFTRYELAKLQECPPEEIDEEEVDCVVVTGPELDKFTEEDWTRTLSKPDIVFARTTPTQKLIIVEHLQAMGHVVAATGDGVNDSPALKKADIGVAMGICGSAVARDAAAVILMDDNFASIVVGIREGRTIFDNLTKTIAYTVTHMMPEIMPVFLSLILGLPPMLPTIMILTIDLFTEMAPAVSMAYEPSEADVMSKPPRNAATDRLVSWQVVGYCVYQAGLIETGAGILAFFLVFRYYGVAASTLFQASYFLGSENSDDMPTFPGCVSHTSRGSGSYALGSLCLDTGEQEEVLFQAQTAYYAMLTCAQVFHIWLCKTRNLSIFTHGVLRNEVTLWGVAIEICLILLVIFPPTSNDIFFTRPFPSRFWALIVIAPACLFVWQEGRKWYVRRNPHSWIARYVHW